MTSIPSVRCIVLKNHKNRNAEYRLKHSKSPSFVRLRCTNWQVAVGMHHKLAIDHIKFILSESGENPDDFDFLSFDYFEGFFMDHLFDTENALKIWSKCDIIDIRYLGPEPPDDAELEEHEDADQFPDKLGNKGKESNSGNEDKELKELKENKNEKGYFTDD